MVIADQQYVCRGDFGVELFGVENRVVSPEGLSKLAQIFASAGRITRSKFAPHRSQAVHLRRRAPPLRIADCLHPDRALTLRARLPMLRSLTACACVGRAPSPANLRS